MGEDIHASNEDADYRPASFLERFRDSDYWKEPLRVWTNTKHDLRNDSVKGAVIRLDSFVKEFIFQGMVEKSAGN